MAADSAETENPTFAEQPVDIEAALRDGVLTPEQAVVQMQRPSSTLMKPLRATTPLSSPLLSLKQTSMESSRSLKMMRSDS